MTTHRAFVAKCAHRKQHMAKCMGFVALLQNNVCPDPVWKPAMNTTTTTTNNNNNNNSNNDNSNNDNRNSNSRRKARPDPVGKPVTAGGLL